MPGCYQQPPSYSAPAFHNNLVNPRLLYPCPEARTQPSRQGSKACKHFHSSPQIVLLKRPPGHFEQVTPTTWFLSVSTGSPGFFVQPERALGGGRFSCTSAQWACFQAQTAPHKETRGQYISMNIDSKIINKILLSQTQKHFKMIIMLYTSRMILSPGCKIV